MGETPGDCIHLPQISTDELACTLTARSRPTICPTYFASDIGIGGVLLKEWEGELAPVSYASKKLSNCEKRYSTMEKECLAVVWAVKKFNNTKFILQMDHQLLAYFGKAKYGNSRITKLAMYLRTYQIHIQSIKGSDNVRVNFLSRAPFLMESEVTNRREDSCSRCHLLASEHPKHLGVSENGCPDWLRHDAGTAVFSFTCLGVRSFMIGCGAMHGTRVL